MLSEKILEIVDLAGLVTAKTVFVGYCESRRNLAGLVNNPEWVHNYLEDKKIVRREKQKFYNLLSYLQRKGYIEKNKDNLFKLTKKGAEKLKAHKDAPGGNLFAPIAAFHKKIKDGLKVVIFDIPETQRKKRDWIRQSLFNLGFEKLQKSVWIGDAKLPEDFFIKLKDFGLLNCVYIFQVKDKGNIHFYENE